MKLKYVGELDHIICFVNKTYVKFKKGQFIEIIDSEATKLMTDNPESFEKQNKTRSKAKVLPEVNLDDAGE